ncbi:MAG: class I SAM-dependent methyltransferase [Candidatus Staskawiczbacteria bacterium]|jgi:ubiquinone/menaquinone biosynthesis C-methylase UbiE
MNYIQKVKQDSIDEFSSEVTRERYKRDANAGFWESEENLIKKYFTLNSKILDIGCGSGRTTFPMFKMGYSVVGVDITPMMIDIAKENAKAQKLDIKFLGGDATSLDFEDNIFDGAIFANNGWAQIPGKQQRQKALNEIYRVLKPGGIYIFTAHKRYYSLNNFLFWLSKRIFKDGAIDFGDVFFRRYAEGKKLKQKQFLHLSSVNEVKQQISKAGFHLVDFKRMGELSKKDAESRRASLWNGFDSFKSPIFYVCKK